MSFYLEIEGGIHGVARTKTTLVDLFGKESVRVAKDVKEPTDRSDRMMVIEVQSDMFGGSEGLESFSDLLKRKHESVRIYTDQAEIKRLHPMI